MRYFINLTAFTLEDCGQVFIQFFFYERYNTEVKVLPIVNAVFMVLYSLKTMIDCAKYDVDNEYGDYE